MREPGMSDHDPLCPRVSRRVPAAAAYCDCDLIATVRLHERERIAQAIEADEMESRSKAATFSASTKPMWLTHADALRDAARIARQGGQS